MHDTVQLPHVNTTYRLRIFALNPIPGQANSNPAGYMLLTANISSTDTSDLFVSDVTALTYSGEVTVNIEDIDYTSQNVGLNKVSGLARHQNLTAAAAHTTGAPVQQQIYAITPAITAPNPPTSFTANSTDTYYSGNQYYADVAFT